MRARRLQILLADEWPFSGAFGRVGAAYSTLMIAILRHALPACKIGYCELISIMAQASRTGLRTLSVLLHGLPRSARSLPTWDAYLLRFGWKRTDATTSPRWCCPCTCPDWRPFAGCRSGLFLWGCRFLLRHAELGSASILPHEQFPDPEKWTLNQVQGDGGGKLNAHYLTPRL